jgi:hypothetical protein
VDIRESTFGMRTVTQCRDRGKALVNMQMDLSGSKTVGGFLDPLNDLFFQELQVFRFVAMKLFPPSCYLFFLRS